MNDKKRTRKPNVTPEQGRSWLERREKGESVSHIADAEGYDERTIRRHIEAARQRRELEEAHASVLRNALERHYKDLCDFAQRLSSQISGLDGASRLQDDDLLQESLRQHIPRSPIWNLLLKRHRLLQEILEQRNLLEALINHTIESNEAIIQLTEAGFDGIIPGVVDVLETEVEQWLNGNLEFSLKNKLVFEPAGEGLVSPGLGYSHMGVMEQDIAAENMAIVQSEVGKIEPMIKSSEEYHNVKKTKAELERTNRKLQQELSIIRLRRIVPGRCKLCPV